MTTLTPDNLRQHLDRVDPDHADRVFDAVRQVTTLHRVHVCGPRSSATLVSARVAVVCLLRCRGEQGGPSWAELGRLLGGRSRQQMHQIYGARKDDHKVRSLVTRCQEILRAQENEPDPTRPTPAQVRAAVSRVFEVPVHEMMGEDRHATATQARAAAALLIRKHCGCSYPEIGRALGRRGHTGVIGMVRRAQDPAYANAEILVHDRVATFAQLLAEARELALDSARDDAQKAGAA